MIADNSSWTTTIPSTVPSGNYLIRFETIALHSLPAVSPIRDLVPTTAHDPPFSNSTPSVPRSRSRVAATSRPPQQSSSPSRVRTATATRASTSTSTRTLLRPRPHTSSPAPRSTALAPRLPRPRPPQARLAQLGPRPSRAAHPSRAVYPCPAPPARLLLTTASAVARDTVAPLSALLRTLALSRTVSAVRLCAQTSRLTASAAYYSQCL